MQQCELDKGFVIVADCEQKPQKARRPRGRLLAPLPLSAAAASLPASASRSAAPRRSLPASRAQALAPRAVPARAPGTGRLPHSVAQPASCRSPTALSRSRAS